MLVQRVELIREHFGERLRIDLSTRQLYLDGKVIGYHEADRELIDVYTFWASSVGQQETNRLIMAAAVPFDPLRDWAEGLKGVAVVDPGEFCRTRQELFRFFLVGSIARIHKAPMQFPYVFLVLGARGFDVLFHLFGGRLHKQSAGLSDPGEKAAMVNCHGFCVSKTTEGNMRRLEEFIEAVDDVIKVNYETPNLRVPRRFVITATSRDENGIGYEEDYFLPFRSEDFDLSVDPNGVWAWAVQEYFRHGFVGYQNCPSVDNSDFRRLTSREVQVEAIAKRFGKDEFTVKDIVVSWTCEYPRIPIDSSEVHRILMGLGYSRVKVGRSWVYSCQGLL